MSNLLLSRNNTSFCHATLAFVAQHLLLSRNTCFCHATLAFVISWRPRSSCPLRRGPCGRCPACGPASRTARSFACCPCPPCSAASSGAPSEGAPSEGGGGGARGRTAGGSQTAGTLDFFWSEALLQTKILPEQGCSMLFFWKVRQKLSVVRQKLV